ncbi:MAG: ABC transporter ATP-binding protein [Truepera sp.]|nr:ABC transporter ATP-binding protein [Truepera sp.]
MSAITATNLTKRYGRNAAVDSISFSIEQGEVVGFLGPNGAGKTTTLRLLAGLISPTSGHCQILDKKVPGPTLRQVGTMIEEPSFYPYLTGRDNLKHTALLHGGVSEGRIAEMLRFVKMENAAHKKVAAYSQGMRQRLGLARALLWQPQVLLLDEPSNGLDPVGIAEFRESLRNIGQEGVTILVSSHILAEIEKLVERVLVIEQGRLLFDGPLRQLKARLDQPLTTYRLVGHDPELLRDTLVRFGYQPEQGGEQLRVAVPQSEAASLLSRLAHEGVEVLEARREQDSLEDAYLKLLHEDGRPV